MAASALLKAVSKSKLIQTPVIVVLMLGLFLIFEPSRSAFAASGGSMGGSSFSSDSSDSDWDSSHSYSENNYVRYSSNEYHGSGGGGGGGCYPIVIFILLLVIIIILVLNRADEPRSTSVIKLQVCLSGLTNSLQRDLGRICERADTSTSKGWTYILRETTRALLQHPESCISGYSSVDVKQSVEDGEKLFNQISIEERSKFDEETLVNLNSFKRKARVKLIDIELNNEYIVVTILVAASGEYKLPAVENSADLKQAFQMLGSISSTSIKAVHVLWSPQVENDTLSELELHEDYPLLVNAMFCNKPQVEILEDKPHVM